MAVPELVVELAFGSSFVTDPDDYTWTDVSDYVEGTVTITRGRGDEFSEVQPSRCTVTLDNRDGRFTPGNSAGAYYPDVKRSVPLRVSAVLDSDTYARFTGFVASWPVKWQAGSDASSRVTIVATTRWPRLAGRELRSMVIEESLLDGPVAYYAMGEAAGAMSALDYSTRANPSLVAGAPAFVGVGAGVVTDDLASAGGGVIYTATAETPLLTAGSDLALRAVVSRSSAPSSAQSIVALRLKGTTQRYGINLGVAGSTGRLMAIFRGADNSVHTWTTTTNVCDGGIHVVGVELTNSGGNATPKFYVDGVDVGGTFTAYPSIGVDLNTIWVAVTDITDGVGGFGGGTICHLGLWDSTLDAATWERHADAALTGFVGEDSGARFERIAGYAGMPVTVVGTPQADSMSLQKTDGQNPLELLEQIARTEAGLLFEGTDGVPTMQTRQYRYETDAAVTLSAAGQEVGADLEPTFDDFGLVNEAVVSSLDESVTPGRAVDAESQDEHGDYSSSVTIATTDDGETQGLASWLVVANAEPRVRVNGCSVQADCLSEDKATALMAVDLGSKVTLSQLPAQAPAEELSFFVEGTTEAYSAMASWVMSLNLSPAEIYDSVWLLDDATRSELDTTTFLGF